MAVTDKEDKKVVELRKIDGGKSGKEAQPQDKTNINVQALIAQVKEHVDTGKIKMMCVVGVDMDGNVYDGYAHDVIMPYIMLGAVEALKSRYYLEMIDNEQ